MNRNYAATGDDVDTQKMCYHLSFIKSFRKLLLKPAKEKPYLFSILDNNNNTTTTIAN